MKGRVLNRVSALQEQEQHCARDRGGGPDEFLRSELGF
jgi:hypothetical protein